EVRAMRAECQAVEADLSYLRRLVQGRLDIVAAEVRRREAGLPPAEPADLVASLAESLSERTAGPSRGALPTGLAPATHDESLTAELDGLCDGARLADLVSMADGELADLRMALGALERDVSERRIATFQRLDALSAEITR